MVAVLIFSGCSSVKIERMDSAGSNCIGHRQLVLHDAARARTIPVDVWYPTDANATNGCTAFYSLLKTPVRDISLRSSFAFENATCVVRRPASLIIFSHGCGGFGIESVRLMETLASQGMVVAAPLHQGSCVNDLRRGKLTQDYAAMNHDRVGDLECVCDYFLANSTNPSAGLPPVEPGKIGLIGDSLGAGSVLAFAAKSSPSGNRRIKAVMLVVPYIQGLLSTSELQKINVPVFMVGGVRDATSLESIPTLRRYLGGSQVDALWVSKATHVHFMNVKDIGDAAMKWGLPKWSWPLVGASMLNLCYGVVTDPRNASADEVQKILCRYGSTFFEHELQERPVSIEEIFAASPKGQTQGFITLFTRKDAADALPKETGWHPVKPAP
jgi:predicted dienelactone hydrolase